MRLNPGIISANEILILGKGIRIKQRYFTVKTVLDFRNISMPDYFVRAEIIGYRYFLRKCDLTIRGKFSVAFVHNIELGNISTDWY